MRLLAPASRNQSVVATLAALGLAASTALPAWGETVTLRASAGGTWTGTPNTCTYSGIAIDPAGNVTVTCQDAAGGPTPPLILNAPNQSLTKDLAMPALNLGSYVQATDGDPITGYSYTGALPTGLNFNTATGAITGTPTAVGTSTINWTATDKDGAGTSDAIQITVSAPPADGCPTAPGNYTVLDYPNYASSTATLITTIGAGNGLALRFSINKTSYPLGYKLSDATGGSKFYRISRCPGGTDGPLDGQNGAVSVNGDARLDNCQMVGSFVRYKETSGASPTYYNSPNLLYQTSCFLPTTTTQGSATPATYYLNILNTGTSTVSIQFQNQAQLN
jgi:hypothetical protein